MEYSKTLALSLLSIGVHTSKSVAGNLGPSNQAEKPVNIIIMLTDDQRWDAIGYGGNNVIKTPNIDTLCEKGTQFRNAFVTTPVSCASRTSVLTGQFARTNGVYDFSTPIQLETTYPAILKSNGYYTGFIGKWGTMETDKNYFDMSADLFDYWGGSMGQANFWHEKDCNYVLNNGTTEKHNFQCNCPADSRGVAGEGIRVGNYNMKNPVQLETYVIPQKVKQFLSQRDVNKPFCLSISYKSPHAPWGDYDKQFEDNYKGVPMPIAKSVNKEDALSRPDFLRVSLNNSTDYLTKIETKDNVSGPLQNSMRQYYKLISGLDNSVGQLITELKKNGLYDNTVIIFLSDNGHFMSEHGFTGKWLMYDESIRVPFFVFDPRNIKNKSVCDEMILNIDVAPTVLELAGISSPKTIQGKSILPLIDNPNKQFRDEIFAEHHFTNTPGINHIERSECLRTKEWKYIRYIDQEGKNAEELYNLILDPLEMNNLSENSESKDALIMMREKYTNYFSVIPCDGCTETFDSDKPVVSYDSEYNQSFTTTWDNTAYYNQWVTINPTCFSATDIANGYLQFAWTQKRIMCSKTVYGSPYVFQTTLDYAGGSKDGGMVLRYNEAALSDNLQTKGVTSTYNHIGIALYPKDANTYRIQFNGTEAAATTLQTIITLPKPGGITSLLTGQHTVRVEDFGDKIYIYINGSAFAKIVLGGLSGTTYTSGTVYNAALTQVGAFSDMVVPAIGKIAVAQRGASIRLYSALVKTNITGLSNIINIPKKSEVSAYIQNNKAVVDLTKVSGKNDIQLFDLPGKLLNRTQVTNVRKLTLKPVLDKGVYILRIDHDKVSNSIKLINN